MDQVLLERLIGAFWKQFKEAVEVSGLFTGQSVEDSEQALCYSPCRRSDIV